MHPSNKITLENLKEVVYWHRPNAEAIVKFEAVAKACEAAMKAYLEYYNYPAEKNGEGEEEALQSAKARVEEFTLAIIANAPASRDRTTALNSISGVFDFHLDEEQDGLQCFRAARMWTNSAISIDPASALPIDHERASK